MFNSCYINMFTFPFVLFGYKCKKLVTCILKMVTFPGRSPKSNIVCPGKHCPIAIGFR